MISETQKLQSLIVHYERQLHCQVTRYQMVEPTASSEVTANDR